MKLIIVTDAWEPQVNGVVNTYKNIIPILESFGHKVQCITPYNEGFNRSVFRYYPEIEYVTNLSYAYRVIADSINNGTFVHIATEGPLGVLARNYCVKNKLAFSTGFHSLFPEFIQYRWNIPTALTYPYFKWFHKHSKAILAPTNQIKIHLAKKGFSNVGVWTRGVDETLFSPNRMTKKDDYILCVSRVSKEKGLDDFCKLNHPKKVLIGDGPYYNSLRKKYPDVIMPGKKCGVELAEWYANASTFVFPSKTDTFGIVLLEAIASGTPVAAYPQPGPKEVIENGINGYISDDLQLAVDQCKTVDRYSTFLSSGKWTWAASAQQLLSYIQKINFYAHNHYV